jgi:dipeptidyl aminopeptidase/acylaminoacyl peptidase
VLNVLDVATGIARAIYTVKEPMVITGIAASPDGRQLVLNVVGERDATSVIALMPAAGGTPRDIYRFGPTEWPSVGTGIAWSRDGQQILFGVVQHSDLTNDKIDVRALPVTGGIPRSIGIPPARIVSLQISPDGRHVAYGINDFSAELWTMEPPRLETAGRRAGTK